MIMCSWILPSYLENGASEMRGTSTRTCRSPIPSRARKAWKVKGRKTLVYNGMGKVDGGVGLDGASDNFGLGSRLVHIDSGGVGMECVNVLSAPTTLIVRAGCIIMAKKLFLVASRHHTRNTAFGHQRNLVT